MVSGDAVNVAARLQQAARTRRDARGRANARGDEPRGLVRAAREVDAKGKRAEFPVGSRLRRGHAGDPSPAGIAGLTAPLIGQGVGACMLTAVCSRVSRETSTAARDALRAGRGREVAPAGRAARASRGARVLEGRCLPYGRGARTGPSPRQRRDALGSWTRTRTTSPPRSSEGRSTLLAAGRAAMCWKRSPGRSAIAVRARRSHRDPPMPSPLAEAWQRYIGAWGCGSWSCSWSRTSTGPRRRYSIWSSTSPKHSRTPASCWCAARPELLERGPAGAPASRSTTIALGPLSRDESARLVSSLLGEAERGGRGRDRSSQAPRAIRSSSRRCCRC